MQRLLNLFGVNIDVMADIYILDYAICVLKFFQEVSLTLKQ